MCFVQIRWWYAYLTTDTTVLDWIGNRFVVHNVAASHISLSDGEVLRGALLHEEATSVIWRGWLDEYPTRNR